MNETIDYVNREFVANPEAYRNKVDELNQEIILKDEKFYILREDESVPEVSK